MAFFQFFNLLFTGSDRAIVPTDHCAELGIIAILG